MLHNGDDIDRMIHEAHVKRIMEHSAAKLGMVELMKYLVLTYDIDPFQEYTVDEIDKIFDTLADTATESLNAARDLAEK